MKTLFRKVEIVQALRHLAHTRVSLVVATLCLVVIGLLWIMPLAWFSSTRVTLSARSQSVELRLKEPLRWIDGCRLDSTRTRIEQAVQIDLGIAEPAGIAAKGAAWASVSARDSAASPLRVSLSELAVAEGGETLTFGVTSDRTMVLTADGPGITGALGMYGQGIVEGGRELFTCDIADTFSLDRPRRLYFRHDSTASGRMMLTGRLLDSIRMVDIPIQGISFVTKDLYGPRFHSAMISGTLSMPDLGRSIPLQSGEPVAFTNIEGIVTEMVIGKEIEISFLGTADEIELGPQGYSRELTPTVLEYVYSNEEWFLLCNAVIFLFSLMSGMKKR